MQFRRRAANICLDMCETLSRVKASQRKRVSKLERLFEATQHHYKSRFMSRISVRLARRTTSNFFGGELRFSVSIATNVWMKNAHSHPYTMATQRALTICAKFF